MAVMSPTMVPAPKRRLGKKCVRSSREMVLVTKWFLEHFVRCWKMVLEELHPYFSFLPVIEFV